MLTPRSDNRPAWYILGAGAIGCLYAANCAADTPVRLILSKQRKAELEQTGTSIEIQHVDGSKSHIAAAQLSTPDTNTAIERLILSTKAHQSLSALSDIAHRLAPQVTIILLQNGMGVAEEIHKRHPNARLVLASTTHGAWRRDRNTVVHAGCGETLFDARCAEQLKTTIMSELSHPNFVWQAVDDMPSRLWQKLAINCAINPLTAILRCRNGELVNHDVSEQQASACSEVHAVAKASGIPLPDSNVLLGRVSQVMDSTAKNRSSMLQDVLAGRDTEIDFLNGYVARLGSKLGIECPTNQSLWRQIKALQPENNHRDDQ